MDRRRVCLAVLVVASWLAIVGAALVAWAAVVSHEPWHLAWGGAGIALAVAGGLVAHRTLERHPG